MSDNKTSKKISDLAKVQNLRHVALIMDGNGRWAAARKMPRVFGHKKGGEAVRKICNYAAKIGLEYLTLYAFSSENWDRPKAEVDALMNLLLKAIKKYGKDFVKNEMRFMTIGNIEVLPKNCQDAISELKEKTKNFTKTTIVLALNYGSRDELVRATSFLLNSGIKKVQWTDIANALDTAKIPDPDLLIRTSGELRISNYLLLQAAYAELYFTDVLWPDFSEAEFQKALDEYSKRERRYGKTSEQIKND